MFYTLLKCEFETDEFLCVCLNRMGCGALDYRQQAQQMELRTGGMSVSTQVIPDTAQLDVYEQVGARSASFGFPLRSARSLQMCVPLQPRRMQIGNNLNV